MDERMKELGLSLQLAQNVSVTNRLSPHASGFYSDFFSLPLVTLFMMLPLVYLRVIACAHCFRISSTRCSLRNRFILTQTINAVSQGKECSARLLSA